MITVDGESNCQKSAVKKCQIRNTAPRSIGGKRLTIRGWQRAHFGIRWNLVQRRPDLGPHFVQSCVPVLINELSCCQPVCDTKRGSGAHPRRT